MLQHGVACCNGRYRDEIMALRADKEQLERANANAQSIDSEIAKVSEMRAILQVCCTFARCMLHRLGAPKALGDALLPSRVDRRSAGRTVGLVPWSNVCRGGFLALRAPSALPCRMRLYYSAELLLSSCALLCACVRACVRACG